MYSKLKMSALNKDVKLWKTAVEVRNADTAQIKGKIPDWLNGSYLRVGPGKFDFNSDFSLNHWFDGFAIISKFDICGQSGKVSYTSKYLESDCYKRALKAQKPVVNEFGTRGHTEEGKNIFSRIMSTIVPELSDNANVAFFTLRNQKKLFVTGESCFFHELDYSTLTSGERFDTNKLLGLYICTAHPLTDDFGATYNIGTSVKTGLRYNIIKIPPQTSDTETDKYQFKRSKIICTINSRWSTFFSYNHSFGLTKNYIIFIEQPYLLNITSLLASSMQNKGESAHNWLEWHPEYSNRFYVIDKNSGKIVNKSIEIVTKEPFFFLHFINSFESEDGSQITVDLSAYDNPNILAAQDLNRLRSSFIGSSGLNEDDLINQASCTRFIIPLDNTQLNDSIIKRGKSIILLEPELILKKGLELPTINKQFQGKNYRFYYASGLTTQGYFKNSVCKVDVNEKQCVLWRESEHFILGEPIFVPDLTSTCRKDKEDAGVLIVPMTDSRKDEPDMILFLDPENMSELGRAVFNESIPCSLHGIFVSNAKNCESKD